MATVNLKKSEWTVLPEGSGPLPHEVMEAFKQTKLRLENTLWGQIDLESREWREQFNYAVFKVALLRIFNSLSLSKKISKSVANDVRRLLSHIPATFEFQSPKEALSYRFPNGLNLIESLYECGYFDAEFSKGRRSSIQGKDDGTEANRPEKNVESLEKIARAFDLPELSEDRKRILRIAGCFNRAVESDGIPSMDCRIAASRFSQGMLEKGWMDPNEPIGSYDETPFYLMAKYSVDPRNFESMALAVSLYRAVLSEYDPERNERFAFVTINPHLPNRGNVYLRQTVRKRYEELLSHEVSKETLQWTYHQTILMIRDIESEWELFERAKPEPSGVRANRKKLQAAYAQNP